MANNSVKHNPLKDLEAFGQSIWLDYIRRDLITSGDLRRLIEEDGLGGMTSNPAIFEAAITGSHDYDDDIRSMTAANKSVLDIYEAISAKDVGSAADEFRAVYTRLNGKDGYVSLEVNPHLVRDTQGTIEEARRLWKTLNRPNVFIKVPATMEGIPAIQQLLSEGININITLLFGLPRYRQVAEAHVAALAARQAKGESLKGIASVASFFLSRIDTLVDPVLDKIVAQGGELAELAKQVHGEVAIASAKVAYNIYHEVYGTAQFRELADHGAQTQRLLWASTGTKNPAYSDVKYVESLIGPDTVNTVPRDTLDAYRDHGQPALRLEQDLAHAQWVLAQLPKLGIDIDQVADQLETEAVEKFNKPFDKLIDSLARERWIATTSAK